MLKLYGKRVDGIILGSSDSEEQVEIAEGDIPCVIINRIIENVPSILLTTKMVLIKQQYLVNLGHEELL